MATMHRAAVIPVEVIVPVLGGANVLRLPTATATLPVYSPHRFLVSVPSRARSGLLRTLRASENGC
jgi:hypothetical protein